MSASEPQTFGGLAINTYYQIRNTYDIQFVAMAVVVYDILVTFDDEIALVWKRQPWNLASLAYLVNRYFVLLQSVLNIVTSLDPWLSPASCVSLNIFAGVWSIPIIVTMIETLLVLRVGALFGNRRAVIIPLWLLLLASFITTATLAGYISPGITPIASPLPAVTGCFFVDSNVAPRVLSMIWIPSLFLELLLVVLTVIRTYQHVRAAVQTPVLSLILRDGCLYFIAIFVLMMLNAICYGLPDQTGAYETAFLEPELCISSVLCSRLFLNLRGVLYRDKKASTLDMIESPTPMEEHEMGSWQTSGGETTLVHVSRDLPSM